MQDPREIHDSDSNNEEVKLRKIIPTKSSKNLLTPTSSEDNIHRIEDSNQEGSDQIIMEMEVHEETDQKIETVAPQISYQKKKFPTGDDTDYIYVPPHPKKKGTLSDQIGSKEYRQAFERIQDPPTPNESVSFFRKNLAGEKKPLVKPPVPPRINREQVISPQQLQQSLANINPLKRLLWHHIREKGYPVLTLNDIVITGGSIVISALSLFLYWLPTFNFAAGNSELLGEPLTVIVLESGVNIANFNLSTLATSETLSSYFGRKLPPEIERLINEKKHNVVLSVISKGGVMIASLISALPFAASVEGSLYEQIIVEVTTAFINNYGLNSLFLNHCRMLQQKLTRNPQKKALYALKNGTIYTLATAVKDAISLKRLNPEFTPDKATQDTQSPELLFEYFIDYIDKLSIPFPDPLSWKGFILRRILPGIIGAHIPLMGMTGYNLNLFEFLYKKLNNWLGVATATHGSIPLAIVFAFVFQYIAMSAAAITFMDFADLIARKSEPSLARQLYPTRTKIANTVMLISALFSFGTSEYFISNSHFFNGDGVLADLKILFLIYGVLSPDIFNGFGGFNFVQVVTEKCAEFWGRIDRKEKAHFALEMRELINDINLKMSDLKFLESLSDLTPEQRKALVTLPPHQDVEQLLQVARGELYDEESLGATPLRELSTLLSATTHQKYQKIPEPTRNELKKEFKEGTSLNDVRKKIQSYGSSTSASIRKWFWNKSDAKEVASQNDSLINDDQKASGWSRCTIV